MRTETLTTTLDAESAGRVAGELLARQSEGLRLYRPRKEQMTIHLSKAKELLVRGGNIAGKTVAALTEFASCVTGVQLIGCDDRPIPFKYKTRDPFEVWVIGYDERHIGGTIWPKLFQPGLFRVIRDQITGTLRAWKPWLPEDKARELETEPSPQLIPERLLFPDGKSFAWSSKADHVFTSCQLTNGNKIYAFSSGSVPGQGRPVKFILIDEDIVNPEAVPEWIARLTMAPASKCGGKRVMHGRILWSAWPWSKNDALVLMSRRAAEEDRVPPDVEEVLLTFSGNPYVPEEERRTAMKAWAAHGPHVLLARDQGQFVQGLELVFPQFSVATHCMPGTQHDEIEKELLAEDWRVPAEWTKYLVLDPGTATPGVLFAAVPPPHLGNFLVIYDEILGNQIDASRLARMVCEKSSGVSYENFIIDAHAARTTPMGFGKTVHDHYRDAWNQFNLKSRISGSSFCLGSDDIGARNLTISSWLETRSDGSTKIRIIKHKCPQLIETFHRYHRQVTKDAISEKTVEKKCDLISCLGYLVASNPTYMPPDQAVAVESSGMLAFRAHQKAKEAREGHGSGFYVGSGSAA